MKPEGVIQPNGEVPLTLYFHVIKENLYCMVMQSDDKNTSVVKITEQ